MIFYKASYRQILNIPGAYLVTDNWNDWGYYTLFRLYYVDELTKKHDIGYVKIGMTNNEKSTVIPSEFDSLENTYFSLGQSREYYSRLNKLGPAIRDAILEGLNDIATDLTLFEKVSEHEVTQTSLLRDIKTFTIKNQFHRMTQGGVLLTPYQFEYNHVYNNQEAMTFEFNVKPNSMPPTNIHALIGGNGVGKTTIINNMINSLINIDDVTSTDNVFYDSETQSTRNLFANTIFISFSAFDNTDHFKDKEDEKKGMLYSYIGLKDSELNKNDSNEDEENFISKTPEKLIDELIKSYKIIKKSSDTRKLEKWKEAIATVESDQLFKNFGLKEMESKDVEKLKEAFRGLSSGHKVILLTLTKLIEKVDERSLIVLDEPESHLHPPLLSAFIRALSDILISQNGVAIIATHSPVILQELPSSCISIIKRNGESGSVKRPEIETFGENVGTLTREVFGLEVTYSGFHKILEDLVAKGKEYEEILQIFDDKLGMEARGILRSLLLYKE